MPARRDRSPENMRRWRRTSTSGSTTPGCRRLPAGTMGNRPVRRDLESDRRTVPAFKQRLPGLMIGPGSVSSRATTLATLYWTAASNSSFQVRAEFEPKILFPARPERERIPRLRAVARCLRPTPS